ncbi:MAG: class E sortase [Syntrophomonadaceae bacterium]|nr:class E sortase [Syntrophomonadaceae bacterium]
MSKLKSNINRKKVGNILLLMGLLVLVFPLLESAYHERVQPIERVQPVEPELESAPPDEEAIDKTFKPIGGRLVIASLDLDLEVGYGVEDEDLKKGPGFYPQSGYPTIGNVSIAGHRNAYGNPFMDLNILEKGDIIQLDYDEQHFVYQVEEVFVTHDRDWSVVGPTSDPALTLTTCTPLRPVNGQYDRLIVRAYLQK